MTEYRIEPVGIQDLDVEPESVDLILTDPPYPREFLWTWTALGEFAGRALKPGGSLLAMSGHMFLPACMDALDAHLDYAWVIACMTPGSNGRIWPRRLYQGWKPILWYSKGTHTAPRRMTEDRVVSKPDKRFHEWGQDLGVFDHLTRLFSERGDLVCDPFLGGGTTALAVLVNGRRFIGCDVDPAAIRLTQLRIDAVDDYRRSRLQPAPVTATQGPLDDHEGVDEPEEEGYEQEDQRPGGSDPGSTRDGRARPGEGRLRGGGEAGEAGRPDTERDGRVDDVPEGEEGSDVPDRRARRRRVGRDVNGAEGADRAGADRGAGTGSDAELGRRSRGEAGPEAADPEEADPQAEGRGDRVTDPTQSGR